MKRLILVSVIICILLVLTSCVSVTPTPAEPPSPAPVPEPEPSPAEPIPTPSETPTVQPTPTPPEPPQTPTYQPAEVIKKLPQSTDLIPRQYSWTYGDGEWTWDMQIPIELYDYYVGLPRTPTTDYSVYITHPWDDSYIDSLVEEIRRVSQEAGLQDAELASAFVQSLPYTADSVTTPFDEYPRYPIETLVDNGGDCEDTSILLASLLHSMGYGTILIIYPEEHCAVGILEGEGICGSYYEYDAGKYFYIETTGTGWGIGDMPEEYHGKVANLYAMEPTPILTHSWTASGEDSIARLKVTIENLGSAPAYEVSVLAGFDAGDGKLWNAQRSEPFDVLLDRSIEVTLILKVPVGKHTRFLVQISDDGYAVDQSYSDWFDT